MSQPPVRRSRRLLSYLISTLIAGQPLLPAVGAALTPQGGTSVDSAGNGVPVVNIATPNGAGISHNQFQDYNVGKEGLILNNATDKLNASQLGGLIQSNPNLKAGQEASGIINEVTGGSRSQLQGYTEVAGKAANVMVANPYGITCSGCGFINTPQATLTTGKPVLDAAGNLQALEVSKGTIIIEGQGLDASNSDALAIISRATEVNAAIHARDLTVIAGANRVAADGSTRAISGEGQAPSVAVDTGALGGMYANRIRLVSGDTGVGVNLGNLNARQGDIQLDANGRLTVHNSLASGSLTAKGAGVALTGNHQANGAVQINSTREIALNNGTLTSGGAMQLNSDGSLVASNGTLSADGELALRGGSVSLDASSKAVAVSHLSLHASDLTTTGELAAGGDLTIAADSITNDGKTAAKGRLALQAAALENRGIMQANSMTLQGDRISNSGSLFADGTLDVNAGTLVHNGVLVGNGALAVNVASLSSGKDSRTQSLGDIQLTATQDMDLDGQTDAAGALRLSAKTLTTREDAHLQSGQALTLTAENAGLYGIHAARTALLVTTDTLTHGGKSTASALRFTSTGDLINRGELAADSLTLSGQRLTQQGIAKADSLGLHVTAGIDNGGTLLANALSLEGESIVNSGLLQGSQQLSLVTDSLTNLASGSLYGAADLTLAIPTLNNSGLIATDGTLRLNGTSLVNRGEINGTSLLVDYQNVNNRDGGRLLADELFTLNGNSLDNDGVLSATTLLLNSTALTNGGTLQGMHRLTATGERISNQQKGTLLSGGDLLLRAGSLNNAGLLQGKTLDLASGEWINDGNALGETAIAAQVSGTLTNSGNVLSQQTSEIVAATLDNRGQLLATVLQLQGDLQNSGLLQGSRTLAWSGESLNNQPQGQITSGDMLTLNGKTLNNQGQLQAQRATLEAESFSNGGTLQTLEALSVSLSAALENQGALLSQNLFELSAARLFNDGKLAGKTLTIAADAVRNDGTLQGNSQLTLNTTSLLNGNNGQLVSGSGLDLTLDRLENNGLLWVNNALTVRGNELINRGEIQADGLTLRLDRQLLNEGSLVAAGDATLNVKTLTNGGTLAASGLTLQGEDVSNSGLVQGSQAIDVAATRFINQLSGKWLAGGTLTLSGDTLRNDGAMQGAALVMTGSGLDNGGTLNGLAGFDGTFSGTVNNNGLLQSGGTLTLAADTLSNPGRMMGDTLWLRARELANSGLWQGANGLTLAGETLTTGSASRTLSDGALRLDVAQLNTQGTLQGAGVTIVSSDWEHDGSLLSRGALTVDNSGSLTSTGSLMSLGTTTLAAQTLDNRGEILSEEAIVLSGESFNNSGSVQGKSLTLQQREIGNQGTLTGLQSLTIEAQQQLMARLAMADAQQTLFNGASGKLLTQGALTIASGTVSNDGSWQGQSILFTAQSLDLGGAVQSADALRMTLADKLTARTGSSITALGTAVLEAASLSNQGQWAAKNLTLKSGSLDNGGAISGVDGLTLSQTGNSNQQQNASLLTGGALSINAASVTNAGKMQGATLAMSSGTLVNSGRLQGDNGGTFNLSGSLTNNASGEIISRDGLTLIAPTLTNSGVIQGGGETRLTSTTQLRNDGRLLTGAGLTLTTPQYSGSGWLQAADLTFNAATATNGGGTWIADRATLTGTTFSNLGTTQAGALTVNYSQLTNSGTLLGSTQLNVTTDQLNQNAGGKLLSGGDLWLKSKGLDIVGQLVSLGNLTLQLTNGFTSRSAIAAGKTLTISSGGAIDNRSVMQGQAVMLSAGGQLSNSGQITTGSGASTLSGSSVALTGQGSLQGGGDINVISRSNIAVDGFTGTRGSLTLSAPGSIVNTALLYAANNLMLYADAISNQRGDIMAGNSLWMQKDAAGNASSQVINTSGNIETTSGDITIKTARLLNERAGLSISNSDENFPLQYAWLTQTGANVPLSYLDGINYAYGYYRAATGCANGCAGAYFSTPAPWSGSGDLRFAVSRTQLIVNSDGSPAARIVSGRDMLVDAGSLENNASNLLAARNIALSGNTLDNHSWMAGTQTRYLTYRYTGETMRKNRRLPRRTAPEAEIQSILPPPEIRRWKALRVRAIAP